MEMAKVEDNVVPIIVLDDEDEESETLMGGSASTLADSQVVGFDMNKDGDGESFVVSSPSIGKVVDAETIIPKGGETISVDGITVEENDHASLNGCVASENSEDNEHSCTINGISEKHGLIVGDFVWCKIKNDLWLPGQVYDSNDASEFAMKYRQEGRLLVAFFGDGSCSWCLPSQLLPFLENFVEMSRVCNSRSFLKGVQKAIDEVGRIVESDIICKCIPENQIRALARPMAENGGVKAGVLVPEVKVNRLSVPKFEPYKVLAEVHHFAETPSLGCKQHLAILKCFLSAFYRFKGVYQLPFYDEQVYIEGLEEKKQTFPVDNYFSPFSSDDIINRKKKIKTLAEILGGNVKVEHKSEGSFSVGAKSRIRKVEFHDSHKVISRKPEEIDVDADEDSTVEPKQESDNVFTPKERANNKYLSPPLKILIGSIGNSSSCKSISKCVNKSSEENLPDEKLNTKLHCSLSDVGIQVNDLLVKIQVAAVAPLYLRNNRSFDNVSAFVSAVRNSTYIHGSDYKIYRKCITGPKQKKKLFASQRKLSPAIRTTPIKTESGETDDFISDVKFTTRDLEIMTVILEQYQNEFSVEEKASLKKDIKQIMEKVGNMSEKVEAVRKKVKRQRKRRLDEFEH